MFILTRAFGLSAILPLYHSTLSVLVMFGMSLATTALWAQPSGSQLREQLLPTPRESDAIGTRLGGESIFGGPERLPTTDDGGRLNLPPIVTATTATENIGNGRVPRPFYDQQQHDAEPLLESFQQRDDRWVGAIYAFEAANTFSNPLYFEDVMLERHGHERFPLLQPLISGGRFIATYPMLPYLMTVRPPCECEYKLGHFRPGDCVYPYHQRPPYVRNAAFVEAAAITGAVIILP